MQASGSLWKQIEMQSFGFTTVATEDAATLLECTIQQLLLPLQITFLAGIEQDL